MKFQSWDDVTNDDINGLQKELDNNRVEYASLIDHIERDEDGFNSSEYLRALYLHSIIEETEAIIKRWIEEDAYRG